MARRFHAAENCKGLGEQLGDPSSTLRPRQDQVATDAFGQALGNGFVDAMSNQGQQPAVQDTPQQSFRLDEITQENRQARSDALYGWSTGDDGLGFKATGGAAMRYAGVRASGNTDNAVYLSDATANRVINGETVLDYGDPYAVGGPSADPVGALRRLSDALPNMKSGFLTDQFMNKALNSDVPVLQRQFYGATLPLVGLEQAGIGVINAPGRIVSAIDNAIGMFTAPTTEGKVVAGLSYLQDLGQGVGGLIPLVPAGRMTTALQFERAGGGAVDVWALDPFERGQVIEKQLGQNLPGNFPTIDKFENGLATSIKSLDLNAPTYQNAATLARTLRGYVDDVANFNGRTWAGVTIRGSDISGRALDLAVPHAGAAAQQSVINQTVQYGASNGVTVNVIRIH